MPKPDFQALTLRINGKANVIKTEAGISSLYVPDNKTPPVEIKNFQAIWDTGATASVITTRVVKELSLKPIGMTEVNTANGKINQFVYLINIYLPKAVAITHVRATECPVLAGDIDVLIGMDIISMGDFSITNEDGMTVMSYRIPSRKTIDYVKESNEMSRKESVHQTKMAKAEIKKKRKMEKRNKKRSKRK